MRRPPPVPVITCAFILWLGAGSDRLAFGDAPAESRARTIAVLDFQNRGPSVELEPLRKALARMLTTDLAAYTQIELVARERIDRMLKETHLAEAGLVSPDTAQKAGSALAADFLVQGTFTGFANRIEVHLEVFDVAAGRAINSIDESGKPDDILNLESKLLAAVTKALNLRKPATRPARAPSGKPVTLAVLCFQNLSPEARLDPMEIGFADLLATDLQDREGIAVVEREQLNKVLDELGLQKSAFAQSGSAPRIGQMLGAQTLLLGSFLSVGKTLRFDAHLVAADTGALMQAVSVYGPTDNIDPLLRSLADRIASSLAAHPRTAELPKRESKTSIEAMLHYSRAVALENERRYTEAADEYQRCLYLSPDNIEAMANLATLYYRDLKEYDNAATLFERLMAGPNRDIIYGNLLAWSYYRLGQPKRQIAVLESMLRDPDLPEARRAEVAFSLGKAYDFAGDPDKAKGYYESALAGPGDPGVRANLRMHLAYYFQHHAKDHENAMRQYEAVITEQARVTPPARHFFVREALRELGRLYSDVQDYNRAKGFLGGVACNLSDAADAAMAQFALARVASATGRDREAADIFMRMADAAPASAVAPEALLLAGSLFSGPLQDPKQAAHLVRQATLRYGPDEMALRNYAQPPDPRTPSAPPFEPGGPRPVLLDEGHLEASVYDNGQFGQSGLRSTLIRAGQWAHTNRRPLAQSLLAGYSVLILNSAYAGGSTFKDEEIQDVRCFVVTGGGLLVNVSGSKGGSGTDYLQYGRLLSALGAGMPRDSYLPGPRPVTMKPGRTALTEINTALISQGTTISVPQGAIVATYDGQLVLAAFRCGVGRVVLSGLGSGLRNQVLEDESISTALAANQTLVEVAVEWLRGDDDQSQVKREFEAAFRKLAMGDEGGAIAALRKIASDNPGTRWEEEARLTIGDLLRSKGDIQAASAEYQQLIASATEPQVKALARLNIARCHAAGGSPGIERALAVCWKIWDEDASNPWAAPALIQGGKWAFEAGNLGAARKAFDTVMNAREHGMDKLLAMLWAALCREKRNDPTGAARIYRAIAEEYPPIRTPPDLPRPANDRSWDVQQYARARAVELAP